MFTLKGRTALMVGCGVNKYKDVAKLLQEGGMNIALATHHDEVDLGLGALQIPCDVRKADEVEYACKLTADTFGSLDVILPFHGGQPIVTPIEEITYEDIVQEIDNTIGGSFIMLQKALPYLQKSKAGRVIFLGSTDARYGSDKCGLIHAMGKGGVMALTVNAAKLYSSENLTINCIALGGTEPNRDLRPRQQDAGELLDRIPVGRIGTHDDIASAVAFLASEEAGFISGEILNLSGGMAIG
jgi:NAD(P)-dependent dehydrogenase (short-subunit alcohol dehydrogenase family)